MLRQGMFSIYPCVSQILGHAQKEITMTKPNCWEFMRCGREPGGAKVAELGICPAATETRANGINMGKNGGRCCWALVGTLCGGQIQSSFAMKLNSCLKCEFYQLVVKEERTNLVRTKTIIAKLK
jgi:hypothetical protein